MSVADGPVASVIVTRVRRKSSDSAAPYKLWVDGREVASLENGDSFRIELEPGAHRLVLRWASRTSNSVDLHLSEGAQVMLECGLIPGIFLKPLVLREVGSGGRPFTS